MKKLTVVPLLLFLGTIFSFSTVFGQTVANYAVTRSTGLTYSSTLPVGLPPTSWRNSGAFIDDDNRSFPVDIGFDFWYNGVRYIEVSVSTNGYVDFSSSIADGGPTGGPYGYVNSQFSAANGTANALAPFYDDMTTLGGTDPLGTWIRTASSGVAPYRVMTIEWGSMAVYLNTTPSLNFQVKLYETTGVIEYHYGTMTQGTANFTYTCGINAAVLNNPPNATQLKCQQAANTTTFSNGIQNNLTILPAANSKLAFTPPVPLNPSGALTITNVQTAQMTLNWPNWATNEVGYVIYNSIDNINWDFITQTAANATSYVSTGLFSGTTYLWRVFAVTEGALSTTLNGSQTTLSGLTFTSVATGNWGTAGTWDVNAVPGANDNVIIANGHTVTINVNATTCHNLQIGQGGTPSVLRMGNNNNARTMTVLGNITIFSNGTLQANPASNISHQLDLYGNIINNGIVDLQPDLNSFWNVTFLHPYANQVVGGTGITNRYNNINVNKGTEAKRIVEVTTSTFTPAIGFLTMTNGTFKLSTSGAVNITPFITNATIPLHARLWINSASATLNSTGGSISVAGFFTMSNGNFNIGNAIDNNLISNGGLVTISNGTVTVAGRFDRLNIATLSRLTMTGGTLILNTIGSTSNTSAPFMMDVVGSQFFQSGGLIIIRRYGGTGATRLGFLCSGGSINQVTGGVLQIGDALTPVGQTMQVNTVSPVGGFRVASANAIALLISRPLVVINDVEIQSGIFNANNQNVSVGRNWTNTGGTYTSGTNTTFFYGLVPQLISKTTGAENFNNINFLNLGIKTLGSNINCRNVNILSGATFDVGTPGFLLSTIGNWNNAGTFVTGTSGTVLCNGTVAQVIGGVSQTIFRNLTIQNSAGVSIARNEYIRGTLSLNLGIFTTTGYDFVLLSTPTSTGRIGQITGGDITGNIIQQRWIYTGPTQWRQLAAPVSGSTLQDWNADLITSGFPGSDFPSFSFYSIATYNETVAGVKENGYSPPTNITNPIVPQKGYFVYVGPLPVALDVKGIPLKFNQTFSLTRTVSAGPTQDGWNMVSNPYPSTIDWDSPSWSRTGTDNVLQIWNPANAQYATYVGGIGVNGGSRYISSSQAFWVHAVAANPTMSITEAVKSPVNAAFLHSTIPNVNNLLSITLIGSMGGDQSIIRFDPIATDSFDINYDAYKLASMDSTMPYLSSEINPFTDLAINTYSSLTTNRIVPLHVTVGVSGNYYFRNDSISDMPHSACIILEDLLTGALTPITQNAIYSCYISDTTNAVRFLFHFGPSLTTGDISSSCATNADGKAFAKGTGNGPWDYVWKNTAGNTIATNNNVTGTDTLFGLLPADYIVEVSGNDGNCSFRSDTITVHGPDPIQTGASMIPATCSYTQDGKLIVNVVTGGLSPYVLTWPDNSHLDSLINIAPGNYDLFIVDANGCLDTAHFMVTTSSTLTSAFTATPDTVVLQSLVSFSNYSFGANSYEWNFGDGSPININPNPIYSYSTAGSMNITLISSDGICSDTSNQTVFVIDNTGVFENGNANSINIFSESDNINIQFNLAGEEHALISIYDESGKLVRRKDEYVFQNRIQISLEGEASQLYSVFVSLPNKVYASKVIVIRK